MVAAFGRSEASKAAWAARKLGMGTSTLRAKDAMLVQLSALTEADRAVDRRCVKPRVLRKLRPLRIGKRGKLRAHGVFGLQRRSAHSQLSGRP